MGFAHRSDPFSQPSGSSTVAKKLSGSSSFLLLKASSSCLFLVFLKRPSRHGRDQKTFSAGPRSFSSKRVVVPRKQFCPESNPFLTHDTVESPAKICSSCTLNSHESRRLQSDRRDLVQPRPWLTTALTKSFLLRRQLHSTGQTIVRSFGSQFLLRSSH